MPSPCPGPRRSIDRGGSAPDDRSTPGPVRHRPGSKSGLQSPADGRRPARPEGPLDDHHDRIRRPPRGRLADAAVRGHARRPRADTRASSSTPTSSSSPARCSGSPGDWPATASPSLAPEIYHRIEPPGTVLDFEADRARALDDSAKLPTADFDADIRAALDFLADSPPGRPRPAPRRRLLLRRPPRLPGRAPARREGHHLLLRDRNPQRQARLRPRRRSLARAGEIQGKLLMVFGTLDPHIPEDGRTMIDEALEGRRGRLRDQALPRRAHLHERRRGQARPRGDRSGVRGDDRAVPGMSSAGSRSQRIGPRIARRPVRVRSGPAGASIEPGLLEMAVAW